MTRDVQPLAQFSRRMVEHGRIRFGVKSDKGAPKAIDTFRFTSHDKDALELLAQMHGGTVAAWSPGRGGVQFEVVTDAKQIDVVIPPNALGDTPIYELWSGGGLVRRCDGERCFAPVSTRDGVELAEQPCVCDQSGNMQCKPTTRITVLLPDIPFNGTWRLEAKGWNAAHELPGMVEMVSKLGARGLVRSQLALEKRTSTQGGQTRNFVVPVIRMPITLNQILDGDASLGALESGGAVVPEPTLAIEATSDDDVIDAEVVEDDPVDIETRRIHRLVLELELSTDDVAGFCFVVSEGAQSGLKMLTLPELSRITTVLEKLKSGELVYGGLDGRRAVALRPEE